MSIYEYESLKINYMRKGSGKPIVLLHGWGTSLETFMPLFNDLSKSYDVTVLDFPGFGESSEPTTPWDLDDYAKMTMHFIEAMGIKMPSLLGHSFGGRVSIKLSQLMPLSQIILVNSAGIKPKRKANYFIRVYGYKLFRTVASLPFFKWLLKEPLEAYRELYSSSDYKQASPIMKQVLSKVVNEDLKSILPNITSPVLLVWGDQDTSTPLEDAKIMESLIPDSGLVVFEGAGHFSYVEQPSRFLTIIKTFLGGK
ncbi:alpha/beta fold hydrolase [Fusibacter bizertensis]